MFRSLVDLLFPPQCAGCNVLGSAFCDGCRPVGKMVFLRFPGLAVRAFAPYEDTLRSAVLALKDGRRDVAEALGSAMAPLVGHGALLLPVPTTARRRRVRGIDGVALVARHAANAAGADVAEVLEQRAGDAQRGRSRMQRLAASGRFACDAARVGKRPVTLFDDVCTTGATLRDCAAAVREAGGTVRDALVIAVALTQAGTPAAATKSGQPWRIPVPS